MPTPEPGLVIRYSYLWSQEQERGQEEGVKDRPCVVVLVTQDDAGETRVVVLPITHSPPADPATALEIPAAVKRRLKLDTDRSWVVLDEANRFVWPGPDLRFARTGDAGSVTYGYLPGTFMREIVQRFAALVRARRGRVIPRSE